MIEKDFDQAEREKHQLEELQRRDKHLRSETAKKRERKH
jgi:hypothetical protein